MISFSHSDIIKRRVETDLILFASCMIPWVARNLKVIFVLPVPCTLYHSVLSTLFLIYQTLNINAVYKKYKQVTIPVFFTNSNLYILYTLPGVGFYHIAIKLFILEGTSLRRHPPISQRSLIHYRYRNGIEVNIFTCKPFFLIYYYLNICYSAFYRCFDYRVQELTKGPPSQVSILQPVLYIMQKTRMDNSYTGLNIRRAKTWLNIIEYRI